MARTLIFLLFTAFLCSAGAQDLTLEELDSLFADCAGTPSEYAVRTAKNWFMRCAFYRLDGSALRPAVELQCRSDAEARKRIRTLSEDVRRGRNWKLPRPELAVPFIGAVRIDGIISPEEYARSARLEGEIPINEQTVKAGGGHRWYFAWDNRFFYFAAEIADPDIQLCKERPYEADSVELFLLPEPLLSSYWEIVVSPSGERFCAWHTLGKYGQRSSFFIAPESLKTAARRTGSGYCVEIAFPFSALPSLSERLPYNGAAMFLMVCRTDRQKNGGVAVTAPVPLLYGGHNIYGYIKATLKRQELL